MKHLSFSTIFALAILVILVTVGYFSLPWKQTYQTRATIQNRDAWTTYTNAKYGFELKYPDGVTIEERDGFIMVWDKESKQRAQEYETWIPEEFSIQKISNEKIVVTSEWLANRDSDLVLQNITESIGGKEAFVALPTELGARTYIVPTNNGTYMIFAWGYKEGKFYKDVIATLRFSE